MKAEERKSMWAIESTPGDWPEDAKYENGSYFCKCMHCSKTFIGYKRRVVCKVCYEQRNQKVELSEQT
jgi:hypothetical protein